VIILIASSTVCFSDTIPKYCLSIEKARMVFQDAIRSHTLDSIVNQQDQIITIQRTDSEELTASYEREIGLLNQKFEKQKEITLNMESWGNSWRDQSAFYEKKDRKHRRQKKGLIAGIVILIGVLAVK
jgi:Skp family chaperone for outer membrane proteins